MKKQKQNKNLVAKKEWCRMKIVEMVSHTEDLDYLEFIYNMMVAFKKKWGI